MNSDSTDWIAGSLGKNPLVKILATEKIGMMNAAGEISACPAAAKYQRGGEEETFGRGGRRGQETRAEHGRGATGSGDPHRTWVCAES